MANKANQLDLVLELQDDVSDKIKKISGLIGTNLANAMTKASKATEKSVEAQNKLVGASQKSATASKQVAASELAKAKAAQVANAALNNQVKITKSAQASAMMWQKNNVKFSEFSKKYASNIERLNNQFKDQKEMLEKVGKASAIALTAIAVGAGYALKKFSDLETAIKGMQKTISATPQQFKQIENSIRDMTDTMPFASTELLGFAQIAGQLGVKQNDILKFTETIAKMGTAADISGDQAAIAMTRILNVTGEAVGTIDNFASVIVRLGNNVAAGEAEILHMANEVARSIGVFGASAAEAAGLAAAMKEMGVRAELGGSAIGKTMRAIQGAVASGGKSLERYADIVGMSGDEFKKAFNENKVGTLELFIKNLGNLDRAGVSSTMMLKKLGLSGETIMKVLPTLAANYEKVERAMGMARDEASLSAEELKKVGALNQEYKKQLDTLANKSQIFMNKLTKLAENIGGRLAPAFELIIEMGGKLLDFFNQNPLILDMAVVLGVVTTVLIAGTAAMAAYILLKLKYIAITNAASKAGLTFSLNIFKLGGMFTGIVAKLAAFKAMIVGVVVKIGTFVAGLVSLKAILIGAVVVAVGYLITKLFGLEQMWESLWNKMKEVGGKIKDSFLGIFGMTAEASEKSTKKILADQKKLDDAKAKAKAHQGSDDVFHQQMQRRQAARIKDASMTVAEKKRVEAMKLKIAEEGRKELIEADRKAKEKERKAERDAFAKSLEDRKAKIFTWNDEKKERTKRLEDEITQIKHTRLVASLLKRNTAYQEADKSRTSAEELAQIEVQNKELERYKTNLENKKILAVSAEQQKALLIAQARASALEGSKTEEATDAQTDVKLQQEEIRYQRIKEIQGESEANLAAHEARKAQIILSANEQKDQALIAKKQQLATFLGESEEGYAAQQALVDERTATEMGKIQLAYENKQLTAEQHKIALAELDIKYALQKEQLEEKQLITKANRLQKEGKFYEASLIRDQMAFKKNEQEKGTAYAIGQSMRFEQTKQLLGNIASIGSAFGKKGFEIAKAANIAQSIMNTYQGATRALAEGGPFMGPALATTMTIAGLANVARIKQQKYSGQAHSGMDSVPQSMNNKSFLLKAGERVIQPTANKDLTNYLSENKSGGGGHTFNITLNGGATSQDAEMLAEEIKSILREQSERGEPIISAKGVVA